MSDVYIAGIAAIATIACVGLFFGWLLSRTDGDEPLIDPPPLWTISTPTEEASEPEGAKDGGS